MPRTLPLNQVLSLSTNNPRTWTKRARATILPAPGPSSKGDLIKYRIARVNFKILPFVESQKGDCRKILVIKKSKLDHTKLY